MRRIVALRRFDMRPDTPVANGDHATPSWTARHVVQMLQAACPRHWQTVLRNSLGSANPASLTPGEFAKFTDHVSWVVKQYGIKDPAAFLAYQVQLEAKAAGKLGSSVKIGDIPVQSKSAGRGPVTFENSTATASAASPAQRLAVLTTAWGATKAEVLSRAKAAIEAGESSHDTAEKLAFAQQHFHASQREIGRAVGRSGSWVNRLLKWRRSRYNQSSPFGPTTRSGRATHRQHGSSNNTGAAPTRLHREASSPDSLVARCSPPHQQISPPAPANESHPSRPMETEPRPSGQAAARETNGAKTDTVAPPDPAHKPGRSGSPHLKKKKPQVENSRAGQKLSPERMRIVIDALREFPTLKSAAAKAGIHRKALRYRLKRSEDGRDGYDLEHQGVLARFHEHCRWAIDEAEQTLRDKVVEIALGPVIYKTDPQLVHLGYQGTDAYARDENGNFIVEGFGPGNKKMQLIWLAMERPEVWGKRRKRKIARTGGVLVLGERPKRSASSYAASIKARKWKSMSRKVQKLKA
jgi:hypothetical protein